jgi:hypothetical protein
MKGYTVVIIPDDTIYDPLKLLPFIKRTGVQRERERERERE